MCPRTSRATATAQRAMSTKHNLTQRKTLVLDASAAPMHATLFGSVTMLCGDSSGLRTRIQPCAPAPEAKRMPRRRPRLVMAPGVWCAAHRWRAST